MAEKKPDLARWEPTPATVLSAQVLWRRPGPGQRPVRQLDLRLLVHDPRDVTTPDVEARFQLEYASALTRGQRVKVGVDRHTGELRFPLPVEKAAKGRTTPDYLFALKVLVGCIALILLLAGGVLAVTYLQRTSDPNSIPGMPGGSPVPSGSGLSTTPGAPSETPGPTGIPTPTPS